MYLNLYILLLHLILMFNIKIGRYTNNIHVRLKIQNIHVTEIIQTILFYFKIYRRKYNGIILHYIIFVIFYFIKDSNLNLQLVKTNKNYGCFEYHIYLLYNYKLQLCWIMLKINNTFYVQYKFFELEWGIALISN